MRALLILVSFLTLPTAAQAHLSVPAEVVPGRPVVVDGGPGVAGAAVQLSVDLPAGALGRVVGGVLGADGVGRFSMPATYSCADGCAGERRFLPGQRVHLSACSVPHSGGLPALAIKTSSIFCLGGTTVIGGRVDALLRGRVEPRRAGVLRRARWTGWGSGSAVARGVVAGRRATAVGSALVDCGDTLAYSTLTVRQAGRTLQTLRDLAPC